jgi:hypothetical protein
MRGRWLELCVRMDFAAPLGFDAAILEPFFHEQKQIVFCFLFVKN